MLMLKPGIHLFFILLSFLLGNTGAHALPLAPLSATETSIKRHPISENVTDICSNINIGVLPILRGILDNLAPMTDVDHLITELESLSGPCSEVINVVVPSITEETDEEVTKRNSGIQVELIDAIEDVITTLQEIPLDLDLGVIDEASLLGSVPLDLLDLKMVDVLKLYRESFVLMDDDVRELLGDDGILALISLGLEHTLGFIKPGTDHRLLAGCIFGYTNILSQRSKNAICVPSSLPLALLVSSHSAYRPRQKNILPNIATGSQAVDNDWHKALGIGITSTVHPALLLRLEL
ncbi:hypothetical protein SISNIDRAFT_470897 [Sistotremastrum niveocremeum HHB9708]|uniref:Uncharacterized protein n=1 Tax=Sistotremastrum niveocremeum HHB9708 TaxID=1314777 RepID=A0A164NBA2_9AGAM|nr:hypothetical protein SISNIDRAFT_470897 [Sistotremastrum niveocremeum HHB9708]